MAKLKSLSDLKNYALQALGAPVIKIEVDDAQVEARIQDAVEFFMERHYDGVEVMNYLYTITEEDALNQYIIMPENLQAVIDVQQGSGTKFGIGGLNIPGFGVVDNGVGNPFTNLGAGKGGGVTVSYYISSAHVAMMADLLTPHIDYQYTPATHGMTTIGTTLVEGDIFVIKGYITVDPENYVDVYNERFLKLYTTALIKRQWGVNTKKYQNVQLAGGIMMNGQGIYEEAIKEIEDLEADFEERYEFPSMLMIG